MFKQRATRPNRLGARGALLNLLLVANCRPLLLCLLLAAASTTSAAATADEQSTGAADYAAALSSLDDEPQLVAAELRQNFADDAPESLLSDYTDSAALLPSQPSWRSFPIFGQSVPHQTTPASSLQRSLRADHHNQKSTMAEQQQQQQQQQQQKSGPQFIKEPPNFIRYLNSSDLVIPCVADGNPAPTITWWRGSRLLETGSLLDKRYVRYDNSLVISSFRAHEFEPEIHSTSYKCQASSPLGTIVSREVVISAVIDQEYEISVADQFVSVDNDAVFKCQLNAPQVRDLFQVIGWLEDGQPLAGVTSPFAPFSSALSAGRPKRRQQQQQQLQSSSGMARAFMLADGQLYIQRVQLRDANKSYRCQMQNILSGRVTSSSISGRLFVTDASESGAAPRIVEMPRPITVAKLGEPLMFVCIAQGSPRPTVRWFRSDPSASTADDNAPLQWFELSAGANGQPSPTGRTNDSSMAPGRHQMFGQGSLMLVRAPQAQDQAARFKCLANNSYGAAQAETELELDPPGRLVDVEPRVELIGAGGQTAADSTTASNNKRLVLNCTVRRSASAPLVGLEWLHNGRPLFAITLPAMANVEQQLLHQQHQQLHSGNYSAAISQRPPTSAASLFDDQTEFQVLEFERDAQQQQQQQATDQDGSESNLIDDTMPLAANEQQHQVIASATLGKLAELADASNKQRAALKLASQTLKPIGPNLLLYQLHFAQPVRRSDRGSYQCRARSPSNTEQATASLLLRDSAPKFIETFPSQLIATSNIQSNGLPTLTSLSGPSSSLRHQQQASLKCVASGAPLPEISWTLSGFQVPESARYRVGDYVTRDGLIVSFVNITNVQPEDGGLYECSATNDVGQLRHSAWLNVTGPAFVRPMPNVAAIAGHALAIMCPVGGWPIEQINWFQNSTKLPLNHRQKLFPNGTLQVDDLNEITDSGQYMCQAKTVGSDSMAQRHVQVSIKVPPMVEPFSFAKTLHRGQRYNVMCTVTRGDLPVTIRWMKDGRVLGDEQQQQQQQQSNLYSDSQQAQFQLVSGPEQNVGPQLLSGVAIKQLDPYSSTLTFASLQAHHRGLYSCEATNEAGSAEQSSTLVIHVPPEWRIEPKDLSVTVGRTAVIDCQADGFPVARVEWRLSQDLFREPPTEFKPIISSLYMRVFENGSLIIYNTQRTDAGYYLCQASNGIGPAISRVIKLTVHVAAHFKGKIKTELVRRGQAARLRCEAIGDLPIEISWLKDKVPIIGTQDDFSGDQSAATQSVVVSVSNEEQQQQQQQHQFMGARYVLTRTQLQDGLVSELNIAETERTDSALFTCLAQNSYGNDDTNIQLLIQEPPDPPQDIRIHELEARSAKLTWTPAHSGNSPLLKYVLAYVPIVEHHGNTLDTGDDRRPSSSPVNITVPANESTCLLQGLMPQTEYQLQLIAVNALGSSRSQRDPIRFRTADEAPSAPPLYVKAYALSSHSLRIKWRAPDRRGQNFGQATGFYVGYKLQRPIQSATNTKRADQQQQQQLASTKTSNELSAGTFVYKTLELRQEFADTDQSGPNGSNNNSRNITFVDQECQLNGLRRGQKYLITVQPFNARGAGPASEPIVAETWRIDVPDAPLLRLVARTSHSIHLAWRIVQPAAVSSSVRPATTSASTATGETTTSPLDSEPLSADELAAEQAQANEPILGFVLTRRQLLVQPHSSVSARRSPPTSTQDATIAAHQPSPLFDDDRHSSGQQQQQQQQQQQTSLGAPVELRLPGEHLSQLVDNLTCGTTYSFTVAALNSVGLSAPSDPLVAKTDGSTPVAPDKSSLLSLNLSTGAILVHLGAWHSGACPMRGFELAYKPARSTRWTQHSSINLAGGGEPIGRAPALVMANNATSATTTTTTSSREQSTLMTTSENLTNKSIVLDKLAQNLLYELRIAATNEAGTTEQTYSFSTNPQSFAASENRLDSWSVTSATGGEYHFGRPDETLGGLLPLVLLLLFIALLASAGCVLLARRRFNDQADTSSGCSLSSRTDNTAAGSMASQAASGGATTLLAVGGGQRRGHHTALGTMSGAGQQQQLANNKCDNSPATAAALLAAHHVQPNSSIRLSDIYGAALATGASGSSSSAGAGTNSTSGVSLGASAAGQQAHSLYQFSERESNYAHLAPQHRHSPHAAAEQLLNEANETEMCLGASALNLRQNERAEQNHHYRNSLAVGSSNTLGHSNVKQQQQCTGYMAPGAQQHQQFSQSAAAKSATLNLHQLKHGQQQQQQQLIDSLVAANISCQTQNGAAESTAAEVAATYQAIQATLQQQQKQFQASSEQQQQQQLSNQLASFIDQQVQQQVYATVKRGCPRPPRLCDYATTPGVPNSTIYQCPQQQQPHCCQVELCYSHAGAQCEQTNAQMANQFAGVQHLQSTNGDYQQLRPALIQNTAANGANQ